MNHASFSTRSHILAVLMFAVPLAALGFQVASWWGVAGGILVGSVMALRMLTRGAAESPAVPAVIIAAETVDDTAEIDARRVARLKREFDRAVFDGSDGVAPSRPVLH